MRLLQKSLIAALVSCAFTASWAANTITPQNGNWIIGNELTGKPGRGMGIDVQDGVFVMQLYNYNKDGSATFHMATGAVVDNKVVAPLKQYKNGPYFGSGPKDGTEAANAGNVAVEFTSRTTANITLPGETTQVMHRFNYESTPEAQWSDPKYVERWTMVEMDANGAPATTYWADIGIGSQLAMSSNMHGGWPYAAAKDFTIHRYDQGTDRPYAFMKCAYSGADLIFTCTGQEFTPKGGINDTQPITWKIQRSIDDLKGIVTSGANGSERRILGARVEKSTYGISNNNVVVTEYLRRSSLPEAGTWIASSELVGKAGRGISLDVQKASGDQHLLFMPIYNYARSGAATFHLGFAPFSPTTIPASTPPFAIPLNQYKSGRYLGGPAQDGVFDQFAGNAYVGFSSTAIGSIQFPDEDPINIQRFYFGVNQNTVDALIGTWAFTPYGGQLTPRVMTFERIGSGIVRDKKNGYTCTMSFWLSYLYMCDPDTASFDMPRLRIAGGYYGPSRAIMGDGGPMPDSTPELAVMRVIDKSGNAVQAGPIYPSDALNDVAPVSPLAPVTPATPVTPQPKP